MQRIALRLGGALVIVLGLWGLLRPSAELDAPNFTGGDRSADVAPQGYRSGGRLMKRTRYLYPEHPWTASVAAFGAAVEARGFVRDPTAKNPRDDPTWRRGEETAAIHLLRYPRTDPKATATVTFERPATLGDNVLDGLERETQNWRRYFR